MENFTSTAGQRDLPQYQYITSIISLVVGGLGLVGNGLCARLMTTTPMMPYSCSIFLLCVALSDIIIIVYEIADDVTFHIPGWSKDRLLYDGNEWRCRFGIYVYELAKVTSAWLVVAMSAELTIVTGQPEKAGVVYTRNRSFYISMAVGLIAIAGCFPFLVIVGGTSGESCTSTYLVFSEIYSKVVLHIFTNCLLPLFLILICNGRSIYYLTTHKDDSKDAYVPPIDRAVKKTSVYQMRHAILSVTFIYVVCILPITAIDLIYFIQRLMPDLVVQGPEWDMAYTISQLLFLVNYSAKLYIISLFDRQVTKSFSHISSCGIVTSQNQTEKRKRQYMVRDHKYSIRGVRDGQHRF